jgi:class 3 adenylate cyclase
VGGCFDVGDTLEILREEVKRFVPSALEACLILLDPEASKYTRPLHCGVHQSRVNCQLCKRGAEIVRLARQKQGVVIRTRAGSMRVLDPMPAMGDFVPPKGERLRDVCEAVFPIRDENETVAVLDLVAKAGCTFTRSDIGLVRDLALLAANVIGNAKQRWQEAQQRLTLDRILERIKPFVPNTVRHVVERDRPVGDLANGDVDVTVLFLDVAGYTRISERLSREKVNFIIEKYFSSYLDIVNSHGGDINETAGDGLMAIFQGRSDEHPLAAVRAAMAIRTRTHEINMELQGMFEPICVNIGINSGVASVGMRRFDGATGTRMTFTASGTVTNIAARLASAASKGDILLGPDTASRVEGRVPLQGLGPRALRNIGEDVHVFSLSGAACA